MTRPSRLLFSVSLLGLWAGIAQAEDDGHSWSFSPILGIHAPQLKAINKGEFIAPLIAQSSLATPDGKFVQETVTLLAPLPSIRFAPIAGMEFQWTLDDKHAFLVGAATWEGVSTNRVSGRIGVQSGYSSYDLDRRGDISYNEFFFGWRYNMLRHPNKHSIYVRLSAHELFDINQREDLFFTFKDGKIITNNPLDPTSTAPVRKIMIIQSQATGALMFQGDIGGEYFITKSISIGGEFGYELGVRQFSLRDGRVQTSFLTTDNMDIHLPVRRNAIDGALEYQSADSTFEKQRYQKMKLGFDGWKAMMKITFYY